MKLKDYVTLGNLLGGFAAVIALFIGEFTWACYLIYIAYIFDILDGKVAKLTGQTGDAFGPVFDTVCDFITNSVAASFIIFYAFWKRADYPLVLAAAIAAFPLVFGTIRQAKGDVENLSFPCYWLGVPRPVLAMFALALLNSSVFEISVSPWREIAHAVAAALIIIFSILHLSKLPFGNHHGRRWMTAMRFGAYAFLAGTPVAWLLGWLLLGMPELVYDYLLFCFIAYIFTSWAQIPAEDLRRIRDYVAGKPLLLPLVHRDSGWRSTSNADYFLVKEWSDEKRAEALAAQQRTQEAKEAKAGEPAAPPTEAAPA